jgi:mRNA-degrading endonuclease YafQ of YafQ-DinJ toxin-antitoxin module
VKIALQASFQRDVGRLSAAERAAVFGALLSLPRALGDPHAHLGLAVRKLHKSGIWEARVGLGLRIVLGLQGGVLTLDRVGTHDEVRRYLREL